MFKRTAYTRYASFKFLRWRRLIPVALAAIFAANPAFAAPGNGQPPDHSNAGGGSGNSGQTPGQSNGNAGIGPDDCQRDATPRDDDIVCENEQDGAVDAGRGDDQVTITEDASISVSDTNPDAVVTAVDGNSGDDTVSNAGTVEATAISAGGGFRSVPGLGLLGNADALLAGANATGMEGGDGADEIENVGTVQANAIAVSGELDTTSSAGNPLVRPGHDAASAAQATATGISGGDGNDLIINRGEVGATATAVSESLTLDLSANGAAAADSSGKAESEAVGIDGDTGDDSVTNFGEINAVATSTALGHSVSVAPNGNSPVSSNSWNGSPEAEASATGVRTGGGNDDIVNQGDIDAVATAVSGSAAVAAGTGDIASTGAESKSVATATAIAGGGGDDAITNGSTLTAVATATSVGIELAITAATKGQMASHNGTSAEAKSVGISSDGGEPIETSSNALFVNPNRLTITTIESEVPASGADTVNNNGTVTAVATSVSGEGSGAAAIGGTSASELNARATSNAGAIHTGGGEDLIVNTGQLTAVSSAVAAGIQATVSVNPDEDDLENEDVDLKPLFKDNEAKAGGAVVATANASGIGSDGGGESTMSRYSLDLSADGLFIEQNTAVESASGADAIENSGEITAVATALAGSVSTSVGVRDAANVDAATIAKSTATGVAMGGGDDELTNTGAITAVSTATAVGRELAASIEGDAKVAAEAGTAAESRATGISADGGAVNTRHEYSLAITPTSLAVQLGDEASGATGADTITNSGSVTAVATAVSGEQSAPVSIGGSASGNAKSTATAAASALEAGNGDDAIDNSGDLTAVATAMAAAIGMSVAVKSDDGDSTEPPTENSAKSSANAAVTAEATATGLNADDDTQMSVKQFDLSIDDSGLRTSTSREMNSAGGADTIENSGNITAVATSLSGSLAVPVGIEGDATADTTSSASSTAMGVDAGHGDDIVINSGNVTAVASASAQGLAVSVSSKGTAEVSSESGSTAEANATGLSGDGSRRSKLTAAELEITGSGLHIGASQADLAASGDDRLTNSGEITAVATAVAGEASGAVSLDGSAKADVKAAATSFATGIDAGAGDDVVTNDGPVTAVASSLAVPVSAEVATKGNATSDLSLADTSGTATATAIGISGDGNASSRTMDLNVDIDFVAPALVSELERVTAGASGADTITNRSAVTAVATAAMPAPDVAVSTKGYAAALSTAEAEATATAIDGGAGDDGIFNEGILDAIATAGAAAINVTVSTKSNALSADTIWNGGTRATATATGIDGDGAPGESRDALNISLSPGDAHVSYTSDANAATGDDNITNTALVNAMATAASGSGNVPVSSKSGVAAAVSQSSASASAMGINAGAGDDSINNDGVVNAIASSLASAAAVSVAKSGTSIAGNAIWDSGVVAGATAVGIDADGAQMSQHDETRFDFTGRVIEDDAASASRHEFMVSLANEAGWTAATGDDGVVNNGTIVATALAEAPAIVGSVTIGSGMAAAISTARADAAAAGIDSGGGSDAISNEGEIVATAVADATAVNVSVTKSGAALSADAIADGGTTARANAVGIDGDGEGESVLRLRSIEAEHIVNDNGSQSFEDRTRIEKRTQTVAASGDDVIDNNGVIAANAVAVTRPLGAALTQSGVAVASSTSTAEAGAAGIDAGAGNDIVHNDAVVESAAVAIASGTSAAVTQAGASLAGNVIWDGGVSAHADAVGIDGDGAGHDLDALDLIEASNEQVLLERSFDAVAAGGDDLIVNDGVVVATSVAEAPALALAVTVTGVSAASATTDADARSVAVDAGNGADEVRNSGALVSTSVANANALNVSFAQTGGALAADVIFDGGTTAVAEAIGIAGDGDGANERRLDRIVASSDSVLLMSEWSTTSASGADLLVNIGSIVSTANAVAPSVGVAVTTAGAVAAITSATADARSAAMDGGGGDDVIENSGELVSTASANADTVSVAVANAGVAASGNSFWDGGVTATSEAYGIDADGTGRDTETKQSLAVGADGVSASFSTSDTVASGNDQVTNDGDIVATSVSLTPAINAAIAPTGVAAAVATSSAESRAVGIGGGAGNDALENNGSLIATATSGALAANVSFTSAGVAVSSDALFSGGTTSIAEAIGIDGDGEGIDFASHADAEITGEFASIDAGHSRSGANGEDWILNNGDVTATSVATAGSVGVAVTPAGLAAAITAATADSRAAALDGGSGADEIVNHGELTSTAVANADTVSVAVTPAGVSVAGNAIWDGGATATSGAIGIDGDGRGEDFGFETSTRLDADGVRASFNSATSAQSGNDSIFNTGDIASTAVSATPSIGVAVAPAGVSAAVSRATAASRAAAIDAGSGDDDVTNEGNLDADAVSVAVAGNVAFTGGGVALAADAIFDGGTTARADAIGIDTDGTGRITSAAGGIEAGPEGTRIHFSHSRESASGDDRLTNDGEITATATAVAPSVAVSVTPAGLAGAITTATAESRAAAIDTGDGDDEIDNFGNLSATSVANADTVSVAVAPAGVAVASNALWDGGVTAEAEAVGIDADGNASESFFGSRLEQNGATGTLDVEWHETVAGGDDIVRNEGGIAASATAVTPSVGVAVTPAGVSVAASTATALSRAVGIDTGPGDDEVYNSGNISADATSVAAAANVSVAPAGVAIAGNDVWDGGVTANARATGIETDGAASRTRSLSMTNEGLDEFSSIEDFISYSDETVEAAGNDRVVNEATIDATATAVAPEASVSVAVYGLSASVSTATAESEALGIDTGGGEDDIENSGDINTNATSVATAVNVAVTVGGVAAAADAVWDGGTTAIAHAAAIDAGDGADVIDNTATLTSRAVAVAPSVSVPVGIFGVAAATSTATAEADAQGMVGGRGDDDINNSGHIDVSSAANATAVSIPVNIFGVAASTNDVWEGGVESHARATGVSAGDGNDSIFNSGLIEVSGNAVTPSVSVPFSVGGVAAALATSTATSDVGGIRAGIGNDTIDNIADIVTSANATAVSVGAAISVFGVAATGDNFWDGGTTASAVVDGIAGEEGADVINNAATVESRALSRANSDQVAATLIGVAGAVATSNSTASANALDGGDGDDAIYNEGGILAEADARATSVAVSFSGIGAAIAADAFWDGGTSAASTAYGITGGDGEDSLYNVGRLESLATADSDSVNVATTAGVVGAAVASSEATADGFGISGGADADVIVNAAQLIVNSEADAGAVGVSATLVGASLSGSFVDNETVAEASATGLNGGDGDDLLVTTEESSLAIDATGTTKDKDVAVAATIGFADADANAVARANASGVEGGSGNDTLSLDGDISVNATADGLARSFGWATLAVGRAVADSSATAVTRGAGGGDGDDIILQQADLSADATATVLGRTGSIGGTGFTTASIESVGAASATGIAGDAGEDVLTNSHTVSATSTADVTAKSFSLSAIGATTVDAESTATATATGIDGGEGDDELVNEGTANSSSTGIARAEGTTLNLVGAAISEATLTSAATAYGMHGDAGDDLIFNLDSLSAQGSADVIVSALDWTFGGYSGRDGLASTTASITGMDGGDGADTILNAGNVTVGADTDLQSSGTSSAIFGATSSAATINSTLFVAGIAGGAGDDQLFNDGTVNVTGVSTLNSSASSWIIGGVSGTEVGMNGGATGYALSGGSGNDLLVNNGDASISLDFDGLMAASSWTLVGGASATGSYATSQQAIGLAGGDGDDRLENIGSLAASTFSDLEVTGGFTAFLGNSSGDTVLSATASAIGISGGMGLNELLNIGTVNVGAEAAMTAESVAFTFAGGASASASLRSDASATGMWSNDEADLFFNSGTMTVGSSATMTSTGGTRTRFGDSTAEANVSATATSTGMDTAGGDDIAQNDGAITVTATASPTATSQTNAGGVLLIDGTARARTTTELAAGGISLGGGANMLLNEGQIEARSAGVGNADADARAGSITLSSATSAARAETVVANARGVTAGDGSNMISNPGDIEVFVANGLNSSAFADGHGLLVGHGGASSSSKVDSASAVGIETGHGANVISNDGAIVVDASPTATGVSHGRATGFDTINPANAVGNATGAVDGALAIGIRAGNGDNSISNNGTMSIMASPVANATSSGQHRQVAALAVDSTATSNSSASGAHAYGIYMGDGDNLVRNTGLLDVAAAPQAIARATAVGHGWDGDATARATASVSDAVAVGIFAGNGNNVIVNEGTIAVSSTPSADAVVTALGGLGEVESAVGTVTEEVCSWSGPLGFLKWVCEKVVTPVTETLVNEGEEIAVPTVHTAGAAAYGIWTGAGDDLIINTGSITAGTIVNGAAGLGIGIRAGAGNDEVRFGDGSSVTGHVWLESGDDTLAFWGSSTVSGITDAGAGTDTLDLYGAGSFAGALANFEAAAKHQAGTFTLQNALPALDSISVFDGILALSSSYSMGIDSRFMAQINADGSHSSFEVAGNLNLDGTLSIAKDDGLFVDGTRYDVIAANEIDGAFHTFDLPDPTSMLSFAVDQGDTEVDVVVSVESLAGFAAADNPQAQSMGGYMDALTSSANGEIASLLTILQHSNDRDLVADTLAAITPSDRENTVTGSLAALRRSQDAVHERLAAIRSGAAGKSYLGGDSAVNLFAGDGFQPGQPGGLWVATMSFDGGQPAGKQPAFASENYLFGGGVDLPVGERFVIGGSVFAGFSNVQHERMNDASQMKSVLSSIYGSFAGHDGYYAQGVVSAGPTDYRSFRHLDAANVSRFLESDHTGEVLAAGLEAGRSFRHGQFASEWFAGVNYVDLAEHAFEESGGGSLGFAAQGAEAESLVSELGIRSAIEFERPWGVVRPRVSLAWLHEHDIGEDTLTGHLLGAPDSSFTFRHDRAGDDGYRLSLGFEVQSDENGFFTLKWNEEKLGSYADSAVLARIGMHF